jgi:hypothetical protein
MPTIIKNNGDTIWKLQDTVPAVSIPANDDLDLEVHLSRLKIAYSEQLLADLVNPDLSLTVNDGSRDLTLQEALAHVFNFVQRLPITDDDFLKVRIDTPQEKDSRINVVNAPMPQGWMLYVTGASDDMSPTPPNLGLGEGDFIIVEFDKSEVNTANGTIKSVDVQFNTPVAIKDGRLINTPVENWKPSEDRWWLHFEIPANVHDVSGETDVYHDTSNNIFIPASAPVADKKLKLANCAPVEQIGTGFWDVDFDTGIIIPACTWEESTPIPSGNYHLMDLTFQIKTFSNIFLGNPMGVFDVDVSKTEWIHQNWKTVLTVRKKSPLGGEVSFWFQLYRPNNIQVIV